MEEKIIEIVGDPLKRYECENGLILVYRDPTTSEVVKYQNSIRYRRHGKSFTSARAEQQIALADAILQDIEGLGYRDPEGKIHRLTSHTKPADIAHLKVEDRSPASWKDLIPAARKTQFIDGIIGGGFEEESKNS